MAAAYNQIKKDLYSFLFFQTFILLGLTEQEKLIIASRKWHHNKRLFRNKIELLFPITIGDTIMTGFSFSWAIVVEPDYSAPPSAYYIFCRLLFDTKKYKFPARSGVSNVTQLLFNIHWKRCRTRFAAHNESEKEKTKKGGITIYFIIPVYTAPLYGWPSSGELASRAPSLESIQQQKKKKKKIECYQYKREKWTRRCHRSSWI